MPVRVVTEGGSPVRIVTSGGDPVRIVTHGISDPVRVIGGGLAPDAPTLVSAEVGTVDASTVVVTFSTDITAPCGDCALGFTVLVNGLADAITACVIVGGNTVRLTLTTAVVFGDVVTVSYDSAVGCIMESTGATDLATFGAQAVTNNVATPWYRAGGAPAPVTAYQPKGAANLAASYVNLVNPGTFDAAPGTAPTWDVVNGWKFNGTTQYLTTGVVPASDQSYSALVKFTNATTNTTLFGLFVDANTRFDLGIGVINTFYANGQGATGSAKITTGVLGIIGKRGYKNGILDTGVDFGVWVGGTVLDIYIADRNGAADKLAVYIQALAIWSSVLTAPQVLAVSNAMAAL